MLPKADVVTSHTSLVTTSVANSIASCQNQIQVRKVNQDVGLLVDAGPCFLAESVSHQILSRDLEMAIARHFSDKYYRLILLPNCNAEFYIGWITQIELLMAHYKSLQYSVLACAASHLHFIDASDQMQELSLTYYSQSIRGLSEILAAKAHLENDNGFLTSVILLYLHGCMGKGTYTDIPRHVNAAIRVIRMRLMSNGLSITRPFDRLAVESVLYQIFIVTTGTWADLIPLDDYEFDAEFWLEAEGLLAQSTLYPGRSISYNSPVLGIPPAIFKLVLSVKKAHQSPFEQDAATIEQLKNEVEEWEGPILCDMDLDVLSPYEEANHYTSFYRDTAYLYILISSLLVEQLVSGQAHPGPPEVAPKDSWQLRKMMQILESHADDLTWATCYIANWTVYTLGIFVSEPKDVELVHNDLKRRWHVTKFAQLSRFLTDIESIWRQRGLIN
ncbi:hypothetical protein PV10_00530 [Exophiala mesophila]|uniref:Transcription factor domain-containing protein n=1 Tax=Exophiala mesophila TaxID=212818 RepID=A0A0D1Y7J2_EXOME|nr:uncharacterized protein PV10_00530 [Exophiala mesophila]KIV96701.1 hypothetical protein PV10_00530 [Exophiala mesophila]